MKTETKTSNILNIFLWIAQLLLAAGFIWAAFMKICQPAEKLAEMWPWTLENPGLVKLTGILDLLAGMGMVLPVLFRQPKLTVYAAYGTILLMIAASTFHIARGEAPLIGINIFFAALAVFVAWGRRKLIRQADVEFK